MSFEAITPHILVDVDPSTDAASVGSSGGHAGDRREARGDGLTGIARAASGMVNLRRDPA
jgi:hypothetical protein